MINMWPMTWIQKVKGLVQLSETISPLEKWAQDLNRHTEKTQMQMKTTTRRCCTRTRAVKSRRLTMHVLAGRRARAHKHCAVTSELSDDVQHSITIPSSNPTPTIYPREVKTDVPKMCTQLWVAALFTTGPSWKCFTCPSTGRGINTLECTHTMYFPAIQRNE